MSDTHNNPAAADPEYQRRLKMLRDKIAEQDAARGRPLTVTREQRLEAFLTQEATRMDDLAAAMRNPARSDGWDGAERVASAFERAAERCREALTETTR